MQTSMCEPPRADHKKFWKGIGHLMEMRADHRNSNSLNNSETCYFTCTCRETGPDQALRVMFTSPNQHSHMQIVRQLFNVWTFVMRAPAPATTGPPRRMRHATRSVWFST
ncbi:hypothetical protein EVAR_59712_1 [Eumeta japonica]|uniref:Uncharacterized protein n=1 Tax=Eumeta variegata TaxID=151549 RepID=A0A4C1XIZ4_EUMVA|nr:hypothetical protein EVAR_59712_1 [Eumeta japonica]